MSDTIAAISTALSRSAIGIVRMSGDEAISIANTCFFPFYKKDVLSLPDRSLAIGQLKDSDDQTIDVCLITVSRAPNSYTGENTVEFHCHGSPVVLQSCLQSLFRRGARQALAGEFTKRAFLNNRMDLMQAESVIDLIDAETAFAARNAAGQLSGVISKKIDSVYSDLVDIMAHFHAVIDYPDEELEPFDISSTAETLGHLHSELQRLLDTFERGRILVDGVRSAIVGRPNAGKSSLLNALLGYDRAIVTPIAGTTRDTIDAKVILGGVLLNISDTAGIHSTTDPVELMGVDRAYAAAREASLVFAVFDGSEALTPEDLRAAEAASQAEHAVAVINKSDLPQQFSFEEISSFFDHICHVSALDHQGLDILGNIVAEIFASGLPDTSGEMITNARQAESIERACRSLESARCSLIDGVTPDAVLTEVELAMSALGELCGKTVRDDITNRIFDRFCVGK